MIFKRSLVKPGQVEYVRSRCIHDPKTFFLAKNIARTRLHCVVLRCVALHCVALCCVALHRWGGRGRCVLHSRLVSFSDVGTYLGNDAMECNGMEWNRCSCLEDRLVCDTVYGLPYGAIYCIALN